MRRRIGPFYPHISLGGLLRGQVFVREMKLSPPDLPAGLRGKKLLFAADVHMGWMMPERAVEKLIAQMGALAPDMILWGGDFAESAADSERFFELAAALKPPMGMYAAIGNNDYENHGYRAANARKAAARAGIRMLINRAETIDVAGGRLIVAGCDEMEYGLPSGRMLLGQVKKNDFRVLLSHSPQSLDPALENVPHKPHLALCGHTHGGQIRVGAVSPYSFFYDRKQIADSRYFGVSGFYSVDGTDVLVSGGIGTSLLPLRIGVPPEIHSIELSGGAQKDAR